MHKGSYSITICLKAFQTIEKNEPCVKKISKKLVSSVPKLEKSIELKNILR